MTAVNHIVPIVSAEVERFFSEQSPLAAEVASFRPRAQQREMALAVAEAIRDNAILVVEAGTGTGKTFAYLVPALLAGGKVIISTGTKNLQDQLFQKDLPMVRDALKAPVSVALLKGRSNYVCHYHLARTESDGMFKTREDIKHLGKIKQYAKVSDSGDKGGLADVPENAPIWMQVTSTRDNCLGQECPNHKECFVLKARTEAMKADIVVVNHHLFFADVMLRDEGVAELLPACNTVIFDEAHQLPETASLFFGETLSTDAAARPGARHAHRDGGAAKDFAPLPKACDELDKAARDLRLVFKKEGRMPAIATENFKEFAPALKTLSEKLAQLTGLLEKQAERSEGLENCWQRAQALGATIGQMARLHPSPLRTAMTGRTAGEREMRWSLAGSIPSLAATQHHAAVDRGDLREADRRQCARVDIHFRDAGGEAEFLALSNRDGLAQREDRMLGQPVRLRRACAAVCADRPAGAEQRGLHRSGGAGRAAAGRSQQGPRIFAVHQLARDAART